MPQLYYSFAHLSRAREDKLREFIANFNRKKQSFKVVLHDVSPDTFQRRGGGRWGYYLPVDGRNDKAGLFGEIHLVEDRVREDLVAHELIHLLMDILRARNITPSNYTEEKIAIIFDELTRNFYREYNKIA